MGHRLLSDGTTKVRAKLPGLEAGEAAAGLGCWLYLGGVFTIPHSFYFRLLIQSRRIHRITSHFTQGQAQPGQETKPIGVRAKFGFGSFAGQFAGTQDSQQVPPICSSNTVTSSGTVTLIFKAEQKKGKRKHTAKLTLKAPPTGESRDHLFPPLPTLTR